MKVLFAIDGSAGSFEAVAQVAPLLTPGKDEITVYCSPPQMQLKSSAASAELLPAAQAAFAEAIFAETAKRFPGSWQPRVERIVGTKDARLGILAAADQMRADLIVVGAPHGLNRFERLFLGSVSRAVVHGSRVPVWVARPRPKSSAGFKVLLSCETPERGRESVELLAKFAWPPQSSCSAMTVVQSLFAGHVPQWLEQEARGPEVEELAQHWVREHEQEMQSNLANMQTFVKSLSAAFSSTKPLVTEGGPVEQILGTASKEHADLVVVGAKHKRHRGEATLGSTSEAVLNHAGCSVLVVPHQEIP